MKRYLQRLWDKAEKSDEDNILSMLEHNPNASLLDCGCADENTLKFALKIITKSILGIEIDDKEIFEIKGFKVEKILGSGYYPLPNLFAKLDPKHSAFLTIKVRKS